MRKLRIRTLPELAVTRDGQALPLPRSKRSRALLAYLALTNRPHRRDRLCEVFWDIPDDPRGALRWALSKLRPVVNEDTTERLVADRERVALLTDDIEIDVRVIAETLSKPDTSVADLRDIEKTLREPLLDGLDLPDQTIFQQWLAAERDEADKLRAKTLGLLATHAELPTNEAVRHAREWLELSPYDPTAATHLLTQLERLGMQPELSALEWTLTDRFQRAGIGWSAKRRFEPQPPPAAAERESSGRYLARQRVQFCTASDGVRLAYASVGDGPVLVKAANWLSHLELDWDAPIWSPLFRDLATDHRVIRYDERGNGLSDWDVSEISFDAFVTDLETVVDASGLERFALLGISQGAAVSIEYAVRHPQRVSHLILFGGYPAGWRIDATPEVIEEREAVMTLTRTGWGQDNPAYRQIFSSTFMPNATADELAWFNEFQRRTTSAENAVRFLTAFGDIDVRHRLAQVTARTLVIHSLGDHRIPANTGREIAATIPDAEFLGLESDGHLLLGREPASQVFVGAVRRFLAQG